MIQSSPAARGARVLFVCATVTLTVGGLAACSGGGNSSSAAGSSTTGVSPSPTATAYGGRAGGRFDSPAVQACLKAAGIALPTGRPSGGFGTGTYRSAGSTPTGRPTGARPSGVGAGRFGGNSAEEKKIQLALKACGITLPTGRPTGLRTGQPTAAPSS